MNSYSLSLDSPVRLRMSAYIHPTAVLPDGTAARMERPAVIVCPGGAYMLRAEAEGEPVAMALAARGFNAFVLNYSVGTHAKFPTPVAQLALAVKLIRAHADEWDIGPDKVAVMGFSAGGHLSASLGVMWDDPELLALVGAEPAEIRPDAMALMYPCIMVSAGEMGEIFDRLTGGAGDEAASTLCCEKRVGAFTPPAFIAATYEDSLVPVEHSVAFASAMAAHDRPFELHIFEKGNHCELNAAASAYRDDTVGRASKRCFDMCADWLLDTLGAPSTSPGFPAGGRAHLGAPLNF